MYRCVLYRLSQGKSLAKLKYQIKSSATALREKSPEVDRPAVTDERVDISFKVAEWLKENKMTITPATITTTDGKGAAALNEIDQPSLGQTADSKGRCELSGKL